MQYLKPFEEKAKNRDDKGDYWWELRACAYYPEFEKEKVVWQEMSQYPSFAIDQKSMYCNDTGRILTGSFLKFFLGIFNSKFFKFSFSKWYAGGGLGDKGIRFKSEFMKDYPIPPISKSNKPIVEKIESLVDQMLEAKKYLHNVKTESDKKLYQQKVNVIDHQIDELVYQLYGLTEEEIRIVEEEHDE